MLRATVIAVVAAALAVTLVVVALSAAGLLPAVWGVGLWIAAQLIILIAALAFERVRYKRFDYMAPQGFVATPERFVDPSTGVAVQVWFNVSTGERRYVAARPV